MESIGIVGCGFVGKAIYNGMSPNFKIYMYDKFKEGYNSLEEVCKNCNIIFVCVPTPMKNDGSQDLSNMEDCIEDISKVAKLGTILILKSTILPGTTRYFSEKYPNFEFFFNPEFLTERNADFDFINQSRILIGIKNIFCKETNIVEDMYRLRFPHTPIHWCSYEEAELTKYVCNCFFSAKLSFMNEVKEVCDKIGVKYENVRKMFLGDFRIANSHTEVPGPDGHAGFGGKCVLPNSLLKTDKNITVNIKSLYEKYVRHITLPKIESCDSNFDNLNFKNIKCVTRRKVINEKIFMFKTENGTFSCTGDHLIPVCRDNKYILVRAKDIFITDELVSSEGKNLCYFCGEKANFLLKNGKYCCNEFVSKCPEHRKRNSTGLKKTMGTEDYKKKRSIIAKNICCTEEYRKNMKNKIKNLYDSRPDLKQKISKSVKNAFENDPTNRLRQAETMRRNKRNVGELNGMKNLEARQKVSVFRKKYFEKEENRIKVAQKLSDCWKNGKFDNVKTGLCKWYKYKHSSGVEYKVQGTWELAFIKWLDDNNLNFTCHKGRLSYFFNNVNRNYYPDFWINEWNCYVDIKGPQFYDESKFNAIKEFNKDVKILILFDKNLKEIGVNIDEKTKNFRHLEC